MLYEESFTYALERETFGKKLGQHQVIRSKLADMTRIALGCAPTTLEFKDVMRLRLDENG